MDQLMIDIHMVSLSMMMDHTYMYPVTTNNKIYEIELGSAFNLSSATKRQEIASVDGTPCGITFNNDGTKLFLAGFARNIEL